MRPNRATLRKWGVVLTALLGVVGSIDSILNLSDRWRSIDLGAAVEIARLVSGPIALVLLVFLVWRRPQQELYGIRPEFDSNNQIEHWEGVRRIANEAHSRFREVVGHDPTVREQSDLRNITDALEYQASNYADLWSVGSFWDEYPRNRWAAEIGTRYDGPPWARHLWERIGYASWWLARHDPLVYEGDPGSA